jgi:hypothetical protein
MGKLGELLNVRPEGAPEHPACAYCGSEDTEFMALFGQFLLVSQYYCRSCRSPFDWCKLQDEGMEEQGSKGAGEKRGRRSAEL